MAHSESALLLHAQFAAQARQTPERIALRDEREALTYAELHARVSSMANALRARGVQPGSLVGLHVDRSILWATSTLAILEAGAGVVPLPPSYPGGRLQQIVSFASLALVIDDAAAPMSVPLTTSVWHAQDLAIAADGDRDVALQSDPDSPAFVLCSSGSTGQPKMIVRSHRSFLHRLRWTWQTHPYAPAEVCCQKAHMTTTHSVYELFEPLLSGTEQVIIPDHDVRNLEAFWDWLRRWQVTRLLIVPSALRASLEMQGFMAPPLKVVVLMGEYVDTALAARAVEAFPASTSLYSIYGSTEASSALVCDLRTSLYPGQELPLGQAISPDVVPHILNDSHEAVAPGQVGRLYIGGPLLFSEYLGDPNLTESVRLRVPAGSEWLYDTKDDVRLKPDSSLEFVGRVDDTVKVRGFRVTTREVENALQANSEVANAAVVASDEGSLGVTLLAFVTPASVDKGNLRQALRHVLPEYMVPSVIVALDELPLTASGKIDRVRLLEQRAVHVASAAPGRPPSPTEAKVGDVWRSVLQHGAFELDSSFFEVGGTSLNVFALVQRLRLAFDLDPDQLNEQAVYQFASVEALARQLEAIQRGDAHQGTQQVPLLVRLRKGTNGAKEPLFFISSAGGTLGAYAKLAQTLRTSRELLGVRDPFIWGERDPKEDFRAWVGHYLEAIRERQEHGPYFVCAYSSAGAFGYEIAHRLRESGEEVALLALIDPLVIHSGNRNRYGYWALRARSMKPALRKMVVLAGKLRGPVRGLAAALRPEQGCYAGAMSESELEQLVREATHSKNHLMSLASLFELNTSLPFALKDEDFAATPESGYLDILKSRVNQLTPEVDPTSIERIAIQYKLQLRAQSNYELPAYDGGVLLVEPEGPYVGLVAAQLGPNVQRLTAHAARVGEPSERVRAVSSTFGGYQTHYRAMRDDVFVRDLAGFLDGFL